MVSTALIDRQGKDCMVERLACHAPSTAKSPANQISFFQLSVVILTGGAAYYSFSTLGPLQEMIRVALNLTDRQIALLQGPALYLPPMLVGIPLGLLIDRFSRTRLLTIFTALEIVGTVVTALASNFAVLLLARALIGSMQTANSMNASALIAERVSPSRRGRTFMILAVLQIASTSAAFTLGGELAAYFDHTLNGWRWSMLGLTIPLTLVFLLTLCIRDLPRASSIPRILGWRATSAALWHYRTKLATLSFGYFIVAVGYTAALVWTAPILARYFKLAPDRIGSLMGIVLLISGLLGPLLGGTLADLCQRTGGPRRLISLMMILSLVQVPSGFYGVMPNVPLLALLLFVLCSLCYVKGIICTTVASLIVPEELLGVTFGALNVLSAILSSTAPVAVSVLAERIGGIPGIREGLTSVCVITSLVGVAIFAVGRRYFPGLEKESYDL
jgi:MFS family permease